MNLILLTILLVMIAMVSVGLSRRRREHRRAERANAVRAQRLKARRERIPNVSANLCGSTGATQTIPVSPIRQKRPVFHLIVVEDKKPGAWPGSLSH
jgi:type II secretory pathway pseudopilin PulG